MIRDRKTNKKCSLCGVDITDKATHCILCANIEHGKNRTWMTERQEE